MSEYAMLNALMTPELTQSERTVYAYLVGRANGARVCWPLIADIAAHLGMTDRSVMAATKRLVELARLEVVRRYKDTNNYRIVEVPGLYDRPVYGPASPPPVVNGTHTSHADLKKTAPQTPPPPDLKKTAPETPPPDLKKTAPETVSPEKIDILGCKIPNSDLKKTAAHPLEQVRAIKEEKEQASNACARVCEAGFDFEIFWQEYPKKVKRGRARAAWEVALTKAPASVIVAAVQQAAWPLESRWIPDPHNWLANEQWADEVSSYDDDILRAAGLDPKNYHDGVTINGEAARGSWGTLQ